jgi:hypothetical protein
MYIFAYKESYMKRTFVALAAVLAVAISLHAQDQGSLSPSSALPTLDGVVGASEYQYSTTVSGMKLGATLGTDKMLYLSIQVQTPGWVALGVGGRVMNGSRLFLAYDSGGKQVFSEQLGSGHFHGDVKDPVVSKWVVKQSDGTTSLELVLPASAAVADGNLNLLFSYSDGISFAARHKARGSMSIAIKG